MNKSEIRQKAIEFLDKRTKQKENLVISRNEAVSGLVDFYETLQSTTKIRQIALDWWNDDDVNVITKNRLAKKYGYDLKTHILTDCEIEKIYKEVKGV